MAATVIFPVGHYLGPFHLGRYRGVDHVRIMLGNVEVGVTEDESNVWSQAHIHGMTRAELAKVETTTVDIGRLFAIGVLVEVDPEPSVASAFARAYRLRPLQSARGEVAPGRFGIGTAGVAHAVVDGWAHDLWLRCAATPDLWTACGGPEVLDLFIHNGHTLLDGAAAYLSPVVRSAPG
jgi:hypothetical protein